MALEHLAHAGFGGAEAPDGEVLEHGEPVLVGERPGLAAQRGHLLVHEVGEEDLLRWRRVGEGDAVALAAGGVEFSESGAKARGIGGDTARNTKDMLNWQSKLYDALKTLSPGAPGAAVFA